MYYKLWIHNDFDDLKKIKKQIMVIKTFYKPVPKYDPKNIIVYQEYNIYSILYTYISRGL